MNHPSKAEIVLVRGLPGSGKSTLAKGMDGYVHIEADMYFERDGRYKYEPALVKDAHDWCVESAYEALRTGQNVVVSNSFVKLWELQRYIDLGYPFRIIEAQGRWPNIHGVPESKVQMMAQNWEALPAAPLQPSKRPRLPPLRGSGPESYARLMGLPINPLFP